MKLKTLTDEIRQIESSIAYGSESSLWGDYCEAIRQETGVLPYSDHDETIEVSDYVVAWWKAAYALFAERGDQYDDVQELYTDVRI